MDLIDIGMVIDRSGVKYHQSLGFTYLRDLRTSEVRIKRGAQTCTLCITPPPPTLQTRPAAGSASKYLPEISHE